MYNNPCLKDLVMALKLCLTCKTEKPFDSFHKAKKEKDGLQYHCIDCSKKYHAKRYVEQKDKLRHQIETYRTNNKDKIEQARLKWVANNPEKVKGYQRVTNLKRFGLSIKDYESMFEKQKGLCAICNNPETFVHFKTKKLAKLAVDHSHVTGKTRKLLCKTCNTALGLFKDDRNILLSAAQYLKDYDV
jgi:hypothetical protein